MQVVLIAAGCTGTVGVLGTGVIRLLRRAPLRISVQVSGTIVVLAVVAGTLGTAEAMFVSPQITRRAFMTRRAGRSFMNARLLASGNAALWTLLARGQGDEAPGGLLQADRLVVKENAG